MSDGLTSVYRFEHKINAVNANLTDGGRLSCVGLSGGFRTTTLGQVWSASYNSIGAIVDNYFALGNSETTYRLGNLLSNADLVKNTSLLQLDAIVNTGGGTTYRAAIADGLDTSVDKTVESTLEERNVDAFELRVTMEFGETDKVAFVHKSYDIGIYI